MAVKGLKELSKVAEDAVRLVEEVGSPNIGVHLDTLHMNIEKKRYLYSHKK